MSSAKEINNIKNITENINIVNNIMYPSEKIEEMNEQIFGVNSPSLNSPSILHGISIFDRFYN